MKRTTLAVAMALVLAGTSLGMASAASQPVQTVDAVEDCPAPTYVLPPTGIPVQRVVAPQASDSGVIPGLDSSMSLEIRLLDGFDGQLDWKVFAMQSSGDCVQKTGCDGSIDGDDRDDGCTINAGSQDVSFHLLVENVEPLLSGNALAYEAAVT